MELASFQEQFILHWGEMGTQWGVNRSVAQIHALLYIAPKPLDAQEIADTLDVARSNVSNSLNELESWGLLKVKQKMGDRKDYFTTHEDVWEMFRIIADERKRRELDPTLDVLRECVEQVEGGQESSEYGRERLEELLQFMEQGSKICDQLQDMDNDTLKTLMNSWESMKSMLPI